MTLSIMGLFATLSVNDNQLNSSLHAECCYAEYHYAEYRYAECRYAECHYAECRGALIFAGKAKTFPI
jgi:hypothetical protein